MTQTVTLEADVPNGFLTVMLMDPEEGRVEELGIVNVIEVSVSALGLMVEQEISVAPNIIESPIGQVLPLTNPEKPVPLIVTELEPLITALLTVAVPVPEVAVQLFDAPHGFVENVTTKLYLPDVGEVEALFITPVLLKPDGVSPEIETVWPAVNL